MIAKQHKIVGIHGIIPLNHFDKDLPSNQIFIALWRVLEGIGIGIGLRIFKKILDHYNLNLLQGCQSTLMLLNFTSHKNLTLLISTTLFSYL